MAPIGGSPNDRSREMLEVMLAALFLLTKLAWPGMVEVGWGRIVNIASVHAIAASPRRATYVAGAGAAITGAALAIDLGWTARS